MTFPQDETVTLLDQDGGRHSVKKFLLSNKSEFFRASFAWSSSEEKEFALQLSAEGVDQLIAWVTTGPMDLVEVDLAVELVKQAEYLLMEELSSHCQQVRYL